MPVLETGKLLTARGLSGSDLRGKVTLYFFWAHWCSDCRTQKPRARRHRAAVRSERIACRRSDSALWLHQPGTGRQSRDGAGLHHEGPRREGRAPSQGSRSAQRRKLRRIRCQHHPRRWCWWTGTASSDSTIRARCGKPNWPGGLSNCCESGWSGEERRFRESGPRPALGRFPLASRGGRVGGPPDRRPLAMAAGPVHGSTVCSSGSPFSPSFRFSIEILAISRRVSIVALPRCGRIVTFSSPSSG